MPLVLRPVRWGWLFGLEKESPAFVLKTVFTLVVPGYSFPVVDGGVSKSSSKGVHRINGWLLRWRRVLMVAVSRMGYCPRLV